MIFSSLPLFHGEFSVSEKLSNADRCGTVHANRKFRLIYWSVSCAKAIVFHEFTFPIHANKSIFTMQKKANDERTNILREQMEIRRKCNRVFRPFCPFYARHSIQLYKWLLCSHTTNTHTKQFCYLIVRSRWIKYAFRRINRIERINSAESNGNVVFSCTFRIIFPFGERFSGCSPFALGGVGCFFCISRSKCINFVVDYYFA